jgi:endonuclease/exonuclease/phosphatase family metal-dependent hydrolase
VSRAARSAAGGAAPRQERRAQLGTASAYDSLVAFTEAPYGELVDTTLRVMTWNVWGRFGPWERRFRSIVATMQDIDPDVILLQESWIGGDGSSQAELLASELGLQATEAGGEALYGSWGPTNAVLSRWPIDEPRLHELPALDPKGWGGTALRCVITGPRRPILVYNVALDWPPYAGAARHHALRHLVDVVAEDADEVRGPLIVGGDFNAGPDSDEIRALVGRRAPSRSGFVLFDAWDVGSDGESRGLTWSRANPWAAPSLLPDQRIDYLFTGWPRRGGVGSVVRAWTVGREPRHGVVASDHYAVVADLRY